MALATVQRGSAPTSTLRTNPKAQLFPRWRPAKGTQPHLEYHFCLSFNFWFGQTQPGQSFPWGVVLRWCSWSNLKGWDRTARVCPVRVVVSSLVPLYCFPTLLIYFFRIAVLQSGENLLSVALSRCCSFPFSSSVAHNLIRLSSASWGKNYIQIPARSTADKAHSLSCFY